EMAGEYGWRVKLARMWGYKRYSAMLIPESDDSFVVFNMIAKNSCLVYRIQKADDDSVQVTPANYLPREWKIFIAIGLAVLFIFPVLLSPVIWKLYEITNARLSRLFLDAFCRYLDDRVSHSEIESDWSQLIKPGRK
ncbi:MAG: hypothetical protein WCK35_09435, partial [Chloroflexota bacterium]